MQEIEPVYIWSYKCPCGCGKVKSELVTIQEYMIKMTATFGSRSRAGIMIGNPQTDKKNFAFDLN